jgi:hypothetical protein
MPQIITHEEDKPFVVPGAMGKGVRPKDIETKVTEVREQWTPPDQKLIDDEVTEFFASRNEVLKSRWMHEGSVGQSLAYQMYPVTESDFPEDQRKPLLAALLRTGWRIRPDGTIQRGDLLLFRWPVEAKQYYERMWAEQWILQQGLHDADKQAEALSDVIDRQGGGKAAKVVVKEGSTIKPSEMTGGDRIRR